MSDLSFEDFKRYYNRIFSSLSEDDQKKLYKLLTSNHSKYGFHSINHTPFSLKIATDEQIERYKEEHLRKSVAHGLDIIEAKGDRFELVRLKGNERLDHPHVMVFLPKNMVENFHDFIELTESIAPDAITVEGDVHDLDNNVYALLPFAEQPTVKIPEQPKPRKPSSEELDIVPVEEL